MKKIIYLVFFAALLIPACGNKDIIEEDKFVNVYSELIIAGDTTSVANAKKIVFGKYQISEKQYLKTVDYYSKDPQQWDGFFTKVIARIEQLKKKSSS